MERDKISIQGARENNLKNIDLEIPRNKLEAERPALPSIPFMPKDSAVIWNRCRLMRANF